MEKTEWKKYIKDLIKDLLKTKPEAVYVDGDMFSIYPVVHQLRKKHIPVLTSVTKDGEKLIIRIPSGFLIFYYQEFDDLKVSKRMCHNTFFLTNESLIIPV